MLGVVEVEENVVVFVVVHSHTSTVEILSIDVDDNGGIIDNSDQFEGSGIIGTEVSTVDLEYVQFGSTTDESDGVVELSVIGCLVEDGKLVRKTIEVILPHFEVDALSLEEGAIVLEVGRVVVVVVSTVVDVTNLDLHVDSLDVSSCYEGRSEFSIGSQSRAVVSTEFDARGISSWSDDLATN